MQIKGLSKLQPASFFVESSFLKTLNITKVVLSILSILGLTLSASLAFVGRFKQALVTCAISAFFAKRVDAQKEACHLESSTHEDSSRTHIPSLRIRIPPNEAHDHSE
jgi:hypothetical protein